MPTNSIPPPPPTSGNAMYLAVAGLLGAAVIGLLAWKFAGGSTPATTVVPSAAPPASVMNPSQVRPDDVPPPPADLPDAADADSGSKVAATSSGNGCDFKVCKGATGPALENALRSRILQTRRKCYDPALAQDETLQGHIQINVRVGTNGQVCSSNVGSNDMSSPAVAQCVANTFRGSVLPSPNGGCVDVQVPVSFSPGGH